MNRRELKRIVWIRIAEMNNDMVATVADFLGIGMYTPAEAAMYSRVTSGTLSRWVYGTASAEPAIQAQVSDSDGKTITFLDMIQALAIRAIRNQVEGLSLQKIRQAAKYLEDRGFTYPFARRHVTYYRLGKEIQIEIDGEQLQQATGRQRGQFTMRKVVEDYLLDLDFNVDGFADRYTPVKSGDVSIVMRPEIRLGEPVVHPCGIGAWTLWDSVLAEGGIEAAARVHGIEEREVRVAFKYIDSIQPATAG